MNGTVKIKDTLRLKIRQKIKRPKVPDIIIVETTRELKGKKAKGTRLN